MYLHCDVYVCAKDTNSSRCSEGCTQNSGGSRRRRDDTIQSEKERKGVTSLGPVKIVLDRREPPDGKSSNHFHCATKELSLTHIADLSSRSLSARLRKTGSFV